jgi:hypothetical protein
MSAHSIDVSNKELVVYQSQPLQSLSATKLPLPPHAQ